MVSHHHVLLPLGPSSDCAGVGLLSLVYTGDKLSPFPARNCRRFRRQFLAGNGDNLLLRPGDIFVTSVGESLVFLLVQNAATRTPAPQHRCSFIAFQLLYFTAITLTSSLPSSSSSSLFVTSSAYYRMILATNVASRKGKNPLHQFPRSFPVASPRTSWQLRGNGSNGFGA